MINLDAVTAKVVTEMITKSFNAVSTNAAASFKTAWGKIFEDFAPFMRETLDRNRYVRILSQKEKDEYIYNIYVSSNFKCGERVISDTKLVHEITEGKNVLVVGNGGAGKTFFMRHLWLSQFSSEHGKLPIFIELRKLNDYVSVDLKDFVRKAISRGKLDPLLFDYFCANGRFTFILDGFDEVISSHKNDLQNQILRMKAENSDCTFVISSRYEEHFAGWQDFYLFESCPFTFKQVRQLIKKVPFDPSSKQLFLKELTQRFFDQHVDFLSNPLLAIMMMMTFRENMEIPRRMNIFYDQAFNTLYHWHDATKAYRREKHLDIYDFQKSFGNFCLISYFQEKYEFTKSEIIDIINKSSLMAGLNVSAESILHDYEESVNLIKQEGLQYNFIHRSFQEYFAAYALIRLHPAKFKELVTRISNRREDNVLPMALEMNRSLVISGYISPLLAELEAIKAFGPFSAPLAALEMASVTYSLRVHAINDHRGKGPTTNQIGIGITSKPIISEFMNATQRLKRTNRFWGGSADFDFLFTDDFYDAVSSSLPGLKLIDSEVVFLKVEDAALSLSTTSQTAANQDFKGALENVLPSIHEQLIRIEKLYLEKMHEFRDFWRAEIAKDMEQLRSLDEVLGV